MIVSSSAFVEVFFMNVIWSMSTKTEPKKSSPPYLPTHIYVNFHQFRNWQRHYTYDPSCSCRFARKKVLCFVFIISKIFSKGQLKTLR